MQSSNWLWWTFKTDNYILFLVSRTDGMIAWMVRIIISREASVLKMYKILIRPHIEYYTQAWALEFTHENWNVILRFECIQRRVTKIIKREKDLSYRERLDELVLITLLQRRMRSDLITFKIINGIFNYGRHFFNIFPQIGNLLLRQISKIKSTYQLDLFF